MHTTTKPAVLIIGGGIGGLCLAHGLRRAGIPVRVAERAHSRTDWVQGYRIHINPDGSTALHNCLSPRAWQTFLDSVSDTVRGFAFRTEQLAPLLVLPDASGTDPDPARRHHGISRIALREALLTDLADVVGFGREFKSYTVAPDGRVHVRFTDGTTETADLVVGADGANSRVRGQLLPGVDRQDTGVVAIAGKYRLDRTDRPPLPPELTGSAVSVLPADRGFLFSAVWRADHEHLATPPADAPADFLFDTQVDYVFWAYADAADTFPANVADRSGAELATLVHDRIGHWSADLRRLVGGAEPETVNALRVRSAQPVRPWQTGPVTLLGDAIHNMTPMAGIGANTALRDAELLTTAIANGSDDLVGAVAGYERAMLDYGFKAVHESLRNARLAGSANRLLRGTMRTAFRAIEHIPPLKARMFR